MELYILARMASQNVLETQFMDWKRRERGPRLCSNIVGDFPLGKELH